MSIPRFTKCWIVEGTAGIDSLKYYDDVEIPSLGSKEVLVKIEAASLNYRDIAISKGEYPLPVHYPIIPGSDGAGSVIAVGANVQRFKIGDEVVTVFNPKHLAGTLESSARESGLGSIIDGTFRQYAAFDEEGLVRKPKVLSFVEAATLSCAGVTAWNALFGLEGRRLMPGDWVLTQGTGGVSLAAIQLAKCIGAKVIATTGSNDKAHILHELGADHIINYKESPSWGSIAKAATDGRGCQHIIEVAGPKSMAQSLDGIAIDGVISIIGFLGGQSEDSPGFLDCLSHLCLVRGILVGSRLMMEEMCRAIEANGKRLRPVTETTVFPLERLVDAYKYQESQKHIGNVCISIT